MIGLGPAEMGGAQRAGIGWSADGRGQQRAGIGGRWSRSGEAGPHPAGCSPLGSGSGGRAGPGAFGGSEGRVGCSLNRNSFIIIFSYVIIFSLHYPKHYM